MAGNLGGVPGLRFSIPDQSLNAASAVTDRQESAALALLTISP